MRSVPDAEETALPALSVRQPWAELILSGCKTMEIRTWSTDYRGPLWLHTGQKRDPEVDQRFGLTDLFHGGFVGQITISSILRLDTDRWERWRNQHLSVGSMPAEVYGWILRDPIRLTCPVPGPGSMGIFVPALEVQGALQAAISKSDEIG